MAVDFMVRGGIVVTPDGPVAADLTVDDGKVSAVGPDLEESAAEEIDARGLHVLPGAVDAHVPFNEPGRTHWEGFETGTRALAAGGADLALVDLEARYALRAEDLMYRHRISPYVGKTIRGRVVRTVLRGTTVFREGRIVSRPIGKLIKPANRRDERLRKGA